MIHVTLTNNILKRISQIDKNKFSMGNVHIPSITANKLRKNSKREIRSQRDRQMPQSKVIRTDIS